MRVPYNGGKAKSIKGGIKTGAEQIKRGIEQKVGSFYVHVGKNRVTKVTADVGTAALLISACRMLAIPVIGAVMVEAAEIGFFGQMIKQSVGDMAQSVFPAALALPDHDVTDLKVHIGSLHSLLHDPTTFAEVAPGFFTFAQDLSRISGDLAMQLDASHFAGNAASGYIDSHSHEIVTKAHEYLTQKQFIDNVLSHYKGPDYRVLERLETDHPSTFHSETLPSQSPVDSELAKFFSHYHGAITDEHGLVLNGLYDDPNGVNHQGLIGFRFDNVQGYGGPKFFDLQGNPINLTEHPTIEGASPIYSQNLDMGGASVPHETSQIVGYFNSLGPVNKQ